MRPTRTVLFGFTALVLGAATSCGTEAPRSEALRTTGESLTAGTPVIDFDVNAPHRSWIALTFDDGPDSQGYTDAILDVLAAHGAKATFFVCSDANVRVASSWRAQQTLARMVADGHEVGNHTAHHANLGDPSVDVDAELHPVDDMLASDAYDPGDFKYRVARSPFGNPWFGPQSRLDVVAPIIASYGVHVGWNIDSQDETTCTTADCVTKNVLGQVDAGRSGVVLMHSINDWSVKALPTILAGLESRGKQLVLVEDLILAKYGKPSRQLFTCSGSWQCVADEYCSTKTHRCTPRAIGGGTPDAGPGDGAVEAGGDAGIATKAPLDAAVDAAVDTASDTASDAGAGPQKGETGDAGIAEGALADAGAHDTIVDDTAVADSLLSVADAAEVGDLTDITDTSAVGSSEAAAAQPEAGGDATPPTATTPDDGALEVDLAAGQSWGTHGAAALGAAGPAGTAPRADLPSDRSADDARVNEGGCTLERRRPQGAGALAALTLAAGLLARRRRRRA
jgi:peptidoglycan/xylan/chitin deacetylase (PgdA/CDA1 family)